MKRTLIALLFILSSTLLADAKLVVRESTITATWEYADAIGGQFVADCYIDSKLTWSAVLWFDIAEGQHTVTVERPNMKGASGECFLGVEILQDPKGDGNPRDFTVAEKVERVPLNP